MTRSKEAESTTSTAKSLSKSRYVAGLQCQKKLWWMVHEPDAPELAPESRQQTLLERGDLVGELARTYVPGGTLIDLPHYAVKERVAATAKALAEGASAVYEASFLADDIFVSIDILERRKRGFILTEVKSTLDIKEQHLADVAIQVHVARRAGLVVDRAEVMHLNRECRHPRLTNLFVRKAVTRQIGPLLRAIPARSKSMLSMLAGPLPEVPTGAHCDTPYPCPFMQRCWPTLPEHHVSTLYGIRGTKVAALVADGRETLHQLPRSFPASGPAKRQIKSVRKDRLIVERGLLGALRSLKRPIAFLDFETVSPVVPIWSGCCPYDLVPVQFSCHVLTTAELEHHEWHAEGRADPRESIARALVAACASASTVVAYNAPFEGRCIDALIKAVPALESDLAKIRGRLRDLLPIVRDHVYHPAFQGSFSIKSALPALVPGFGYDDLEVQDGATASAALEAMLLGTDAVTDIERKKVQRDLLEYCKRDTLAMVRLHERLLGIARGA